MIEQCSDLLQCEEILAKEAQKVRLLGEIALSPEEIEKLGRFIRDLISSNLHRGANFLVKRAPACLSCFLVWQGILGYREGDYWSAVQESTGLSDRNWQTIWGRTFIRFLRANGLPPFEVEGTHRYVTPILAHGGIPNHCLDEFFEQVLIPMIQHDLDNPDDPEEVLHELRALRENHESREKIETELRELRDKRGKIEQERRQAETLVGVSEDLVRIRELEQTAGNVAELIGLPEDPDSFRKSRLQKIEQLQVDLQKLESERIRYEREIQDFTDSHRQVLEYAEAIEDCRERVSGLTQAHKTLADLKDTEAIHMRELETQSILVFSEPWSDHRGELVRELRVDELQETIEHLELLISKQEEMQRRIGSLNYLRTKTSASIWSWLSPVLLSLGLILTAIGFFAIPSVATAFVGVSVAIIGGWTGWRRRQRHLRLQKRLMTVRQVLEQASEVQEDAQNKVVEILSDLPVIEGRLTRPSESLLKDIKLLRDTYERLCAVRGRTRSLEQEIAHWRHQIRRTATAVGVHVLSTSEQLFELMCRKLADARENERVVEHARQRLRDGIEPSIKAIHEEEQAIREELECLETRLAYLGEGDFQRGIQRLKERVDAREQAEALRDRLSDQCPDLESMKREIIEAGAGIADKVAIRIEQLNEEREQIQEEIEAKREEMEYYPPVFPSVDEPIRRFLLYAGQSADEFLIASAKMADNALRGEEIPDTDSTGLPARVVIIFEEWWKEYQQREKPFVVKHDTDGIKGRFLTPSVYLDTAVQEIRVHVPAQFYPADVGGQACIEILGVESHISPQNNRLRVYEYEEGLVQTEAQDISLPAPAEGYEIQLRVEKRVLHSWEIHGISIDKPYMAFEQPSGRLIVDEELPRKEIWLVSPMYVPPGLSQAIVEEDILYGSWRNYRYYALNLRNVHTLRLCDAQGQELSIPISAARTPTIEFVGGEILEGAESNGAIVYLGTPPSIVIPLESNGERRAWRISVRSEEGSIPEGSRHYILSDLQETAELDEEHAGEIGLADERFLGQNPVGRFMVRVKGPRKLEERFTFCVVPDLKVQFDRDIYPPFEGPEEPNVEVIISTDRSVTFMPLRGSRLPGVDDVCRIQIGHTENAVQGVLHCHSDRQDCTLPLTVYIPKVSWRLQGLADDRFTSWQNQIEEVWAPGWEDAEEFLLDVKMPPSCQGQARLTCGSHKILGEVREGVVRFDLHRFADTLRTGPSLQTFEITAPELGPSMKEIQLFRIRPRWEVENIVCDRQEIQDEKRILHLHWVENGEVNPRVVRLWRLSDPEASVAVEYVEEDACEITICRDIQEVPPGRYLVQIDVEAEWSSGTELPPSSENAPNSKIIVIKTRFRCAQHGCDFWTDNRRETLAHFEECHINSFAQHLTYDELRQHGVSLPTKIYRCHYCGDYVRADTNYPDNPTSKIEQHIKNDCRSAPRGPEPPQIRFTVVRDVDEIRRELFPNLPRLYKCRKCGHHFEKLDVSIVIEHLATRHKMEVYTVE